MRDKGWRKEKGLEDDLERDEQGASKKSKIF